MTRRNKYHNVITEVDGKKFRSKKEARRYGELKLLQQLGLITGLRFQVPYQLFVNGMYVTKYISDFEYDDIEKECHVVEDTKGFRTKEYIIKQRLMLAVHGIAITEV